MCICRQLGTQRKQAACESSRGHKQCQATRLLVTYYVTRGIDTFTVSPSPVTHGVCLACLTVSFLRRRQASDYMESSGYAAVLYKSYLHGYYLHA